MNATADKLMAPSLGEWVSELTLAQVPQEARHIARRCIIDTIAVMIAGSQTPVAEKLRGHVTSQYASGPCSLPGTGNSSSAVGAALANGCAAHALDFDDTSYAGVLHGSTVILPAVLAAAEHADIGGADFLNAFIAGSEVTYALGMALTDSHYLSGWWSTGTLGGIGSAAGVAKALGLGKDHSAITISLAALQASGMIAMLGTDSKPILVGETAQRSVECGLLAAQGHTSPLSIFEDRRGLLNLMNKGECDSAGLSGLGKTWRLLEPGIAIKHSPLCSATQAAIEVTRELISKNSLKSSEIKSVRCEVSHLVKISLVHDAPKSPSEAQFSMPFAVGCILAFGKVGPEQISPETLELEALKDAMTKVEMVEDPELNGADYQPGFPECARVIITMLNGDQFDGFLGAATGMPSNPMSDDQLSEKFRTCTDFAGWSESRTTAVLEQLWDIENTGPIRSVLAGADT